MSAATEEPYLTASMISTGMGVGPPTLRKSSMRTMTSAFVPVSFTLCALASSYTLTTLLKPTAHKLLLNSPSLVLSFTINPQISVEGHRCRAHRDLSMPYVIRHGAHSCYKLYVHPWIGRQSLAWSWFTRSWPGSWSSACTSSFFVNGTKGVNLLVENPGRLVREAWGWIFCASMGSPWLITMLYISLHVQPSARKRRSTTDGPHKSLVKISTCQQKAINLPLQTLNAISDECYLALVILQA